MTDETSRPDFDGGGANPVPPTLATPERATRGARVARRQTRRRHLILALVASLAALALIITAVLLVTRTSQPTTKPAARRRAAATLPATSTPTTTTLPASTTTTLIPKSSNPVIALAQQYDGNYTGMFTNTTFNTTGPAALDLRIDPTAGTLGVTVDLNGDLYGGGAKLARRIQGTVKLGDPSAPVVTQTPSFGQVTGKLGTGLSVVLSAPNVPDPAVKTFDLTGTLRGDKKGFDATFTVGFRDGKTAQGTVTVLCASQGQRPSQVNTLCASQ